MSRACSHFMLVLRGYCSLGRCWTPAQLRVQRQLRSWRCSIMALLLFPQVGDANMMPSSSASDPMLDPANLT